MSYRMVPAQQYFVCDREGCGKEVSKGKAAGEEGWLQLTYFGGKTEPSDRGIRHFCSLACLVAYAEAELEVTVQFTR